MCSSGIGSFGNVLRSKRSNGRNLKAETAYRAAVGANPNFASAWYNLADVLDDQRRINEAIECLTRALGADPTYADAMFNMGLFLQRLERHDEAAGWWRRYLVRDGTRRGLPVLSAP